MRLGSLLKPVDPAERSERSPEELLTRRNRWSVLFTLLVAVAGLLAVIFLRDGGDHDAARVRWDAEEPVAYEWEYQAGGAWAGSGRFRATVRDGLVVEAVFVAGDPTFSARSAVEIAWTVEDLFAALEAHDLDHRDVTYHAILGYPTRGTVDDPDVFDEEWRFEVFDFVVLED